MEFISDCPECGSISLQNDPVRAELICSSCGLVISESMIDTNKEWRSFGDDEASGEKDRVGAPLSLVKHDGGLATKIGTTSDLHKLPNGQMRNQYQRLSKWQNRFSTPSKDVTLKEGLSELTRATSFLNLPRIVEEQAAYFYRNFLKKRGIRGRSSECVLAGVLYAVCKQNKCPVTLKDLAQVFRIPKRDIGKAHRLVSRGLGIKITPANPEDFIPKYASSLELPREVEMEATRITRAAEETNITNGKDPKGIALAALYYAARMKGMGFTQKQAASVAGITEITLRNRYHELKCHLCVDMPGERRSRKARSRERMAHEEASLPLGSYPEAEVMDDVGFIIEPFDI